jgi:hypothetical protein
MKSEEKKREIKMIICRKTTPCLSPLAQTIAIGSFYEHYKGTHYKVLAVAFHTETLEELVVYLDENDVTWVRPLAMFLEDITIDGQMRPRFRLVEQKK